MNISMMIQCEKPVADHHQPPVIMPDWVPRDASPSARACSARRTPPRRRPPCARWRVLVWRPGGSSTVLLCSAEAGPAPSLRRAGAACLGLATWTRRRLLRRPRCDAPAPPSAGVVARGCLCLENQKGKEGAIKAAEPVAFSSACSAI